MEEGHLVCFARPVGQFATTHWSVVLAAQEGSTQAAEALGELCRTYWYPLYAYVRRKGYGVADAQDLTQEFFARFLEQRAFERVDRQKGRFRSYLLGALEHFLAKEWTRAHRLKRGGGHQFVSWDACDPEQRYQMEPLNDWTAERIYERRWALTVLEQAMASLDQDYTREGKQKLFHTLQPFISGGDDLSYHDLAADLGLTSGALRVAVHRLRQRYGEAVRREIARVVQQPEDIEEELQHLFAALG